MLIPIIKDFNNNFSYLVSTSSEKAKEIFLSKALPAIYDPNSFSSVDQGPFEFIWTIIRVGFFYFINAIKYIISFQWLRDFSYLPISIPNTFKLSSLPKWVLPSSSNDNTNDLVQHVLNTPNILQRYLFSNQTLTTNNVQGNVPYQDFLLGASHNGIPLHSWNLSFLSNDWFDPLTLPLNLLCSKNLSQGLVATHHSSLFMESNFLQNLNNVHSNNITHTILMSLFICMCTGFSSFFNSFFIGFPFSLSTLLSLRYLIIQKFWAGCLSVLGIVLGEMTFMLFLILPPPFIQISLAYLESVMPYIFGLCLILFILIDILSNPYNYNSSLSQIPPFFHNTTEKHHHHGFIAWFHKHTNNVMLKLFTISPLYAKIFSISFLLALTEESCFFSFFGCLNLSSTANFLDTYLFTASQYPILLFFSVIGFVIGSFLAINLYNLIMAKLLFLFIHSGNYYFNRMKTQIVQMVNFFHSTFKTSDGTNASSFFKSQFITNISNKENRLKPKPFKMFNYLFNTIKNLMVELYHFIITFLINFFPGGKRLFFLLSGKKELKGSAYEKVPLSFGFKQNDKTKSNMYEPSNKPLLSYPSRPLPFFSSIETMVENNFIHSNVYSYSSTDATGNLNDAYNSVSENKKTESSSERTFTYNESLGWKPTVKESSLATFSPRLYNKIDKILLTLLITLSFTTIPYYSFDYLVNSLFGFIPQDQILNSHSLRVNFPDYTNLLGITLSDKNSVINTDVSLYDRAHFMYGEWPNSFESLNYQGEFMWTNLRDHRRQKRTRRSTRLKFKTLKTKISTSWKEFKRSSGFSESINQSQLNRSNRNNLNLPPSSFESKPSKEYNNLSDHLSINTTPAIEATGKTHTKVTSDKALPDNSWTDFKTNHEKESSLASNKQLAKLSYLKNRRNKSYDIVSKRNLNNEDNGSALFFGQSTPDVSQQSKQQSLFLENQRSSRFSETIQPLSTSSFIDLSGGEKYIKTYPKNWKKAIIEKYYQNPIYKTLLSSDLKPFLKREPKSQQLTNRQENELYFLRIKMAHYYDSLRFYFSLKRPRLLSPRLETSNSFQANGLKTSALENDQLMNTINNDNHVNKSSFELQGQTEPEEKSNLKTYSKNKNSYPLPPFQFKSMTSMNYRQQFKGTLKTVKQLFAISLHNNNNKYNMDDNKNNVGFYPIDYSNVNQQVGPDSMETFYKYDKYLFNEHSYSTNAFLHEEAKSRKKPIVSPQSNIPAGNKISSATKTIYNMFGSNDPFYVGWDQNLRKFVLTSRILPRINALNRQVEHQSNNRNNRQKSVQYYRPYTCWPFFKHQLNNLTNRSYLVLYENYLNILNKRVHLFQNINRNDIDTKSLTFLYSYSFKNNVKKYVSQLPINLYKQAMKPSSLENLFTPVSNARSSFLWPGAVMPAWEYAFASKNSK